MTQALADALFSAERSPDLPASADLYGWMVGSWALDVRHYAGTDLTGQGVTGELHAARILEGRALQDTWIMPRRRDRRPPYDAVRNTCGTTLRIWDPAIQAWRITWINPARNTTEQQIGRARGADIVQLGHRPGGATSRWTFTDIAPRSFRWIGDVLEPDGTTWRLETEYHVTRTA